MRRLITAPLLALLWLAPSVASAQVHAGVDVGAVVPSGLQIVDVVVPDRPESPLRLSLAPPQDARAELLIDVWVTADARDARRAYGQALLSLTADVPEAPGLGDQGVAEPGFAAFVRDNVAIAIRRVHGTRDVRALAARVDRSVQIAPIGSPHATNALQLPDPGAMSPGDVARIALPSWALDAALTARGDASVRRTRGGWLVTRTGSGPAQLNAHVADLRLRTAH